ncbi:MAG: HAD family phosphatase [Pseudomonadota bacterium]
MARPQALLFDMDGLLFDTERIALGAFLDVMGGHAEDAWLRRLFLDFVGKSGADTKERLAREFPALDPDALEEGWIAAFQARIADGVPLKPTVRETVQALAARGYPMAVVTSSRRAHAEHNLRDTELLPLFRGIVPGDEVRHKKPDPEGYFAGAALLGFAPKDCAAFEDSDTGVRAATAAGCITVQIPDMRPPGERFPELGQRFAQSLGEAARLLDLL